ncbi:MAG: hypothetical protein Pyrs2KO_05590 [Pyruvatibacter sp.]
MRKSLVAWQVQLAKRLGLVGLSIHFQAYFLQADQTRKADKHTSDKAVFSDGRRRLGALTLARTIPCSAPLTDNPCAVRMVVVALHPHPLVCQCCCLLRLPQDCQGGCFIRQAQVLPNVQQQTGPLFMYSALDQPPFQIII